MRLTLITRHDCHLCDEMAGVIETLRSRYEFEIEILDVDADRELLARYSDQVPVLLVNGRKAFKYRLTDRALSRRLLFETWRVRLLP